jgi:hypothetical protein
MGATIEANHVMCIITTLKSRLKRVIFRRKKWFRFISQIFFKKPKIGERKSTIGQAGHPPNIGTMEISRNHCTCTTSD